VRIVSERDEADKRQADVPCVRIVSERDEADKRQIAPKPLASAP
jgi:hypothetical protein